MQTLWHSHEKTDKRIFDFTASKDREMDLRLAKADITGSMAHVIMLQSIGILTEMEKVKLLKELKRLFQMANQETLQLPDTTEDIHSFIEYELVKALGSMAKKVHTARSRNDQVLLNLRLYTREQLRLIIEKMADLFRILIRKAALNKDVLMPGYTHMQVAMPSSFGLWFSAFAESLTDDLMVMMTAYRIVNQNPLGSGAGYGTGFPIDREMTTRLLGFDWMNVNSVYAQMTRGKVEKTTAWALSSVASTLSRLAGDVCLFLGENYRFFILPTKYSTGSSIMPHKKNPDAFELIRGRCNRIQALPNEMALITINLSTGYHRDLQLLKEGYFPAIDNLKECLDIMSLLMNSLSVRKGITAESIYDHMFSVELIQSRVQSGIPFREAYIDVAQSLYQNKNPRSECISHTHTGSIGNLALHVIEEKFESNMSGFNFSKTDQAITQLFKQTPVIKTKTKK